MPEPTEKPMTQLLRATADGDRQAAAELLPLIYRDLRALALSRLRKLPPGQTLQPTALVHEAYLRVVGGTDPGWEGRGHFFAAAAEAMRQILVDQARRKAALKRGGQQKRAELDEEYLGIEPPSERVLAVNEALERLEGLDPQKAQIVKLRYFAGLTREETATALEMSPDQLKRRWKFIKAWFRNQLGDDGTILNGP